VADRSGEHQRRGPSSGPTVRISDVMSPSDAVIWEIEHDPLLRSTIVAIGLFDRAPDWDRFVARMERAAVEVPRLRQRVVRAPLGLGPPRWVTDPDFDLGYHLRRVQAPPPGDLAAVLAVAEPAAMAAFDPERPLWEFTLVEGLEEGRAALVQKVHHSLTDGVGGVQLALTLLDDRPDVPLDAPPEPRRGRPPSLPGGVELVGRWAAQRMGEAGRVARGFPGELARLLPQAGQLGPSVLRLLTPVPGPGSPVLTGRGLTRRLCTLEVGVDDLRRAGRATGGSINDAFLAAVVGGLSRYHAHHAAALDQVRLTMPVDSRAADDDFIGNHFTPVRFPVPGDVDDPAERMRTLGALARAWRREPAVPLSDSLAAGLGLLPGPVTTAVMRRLLTNVDVVCSNVPGLPQRAWIAGAELVRQYPFAPVAGAALSVTLMSHVDVACIGVACDAAAVTDPALLCECLHAGLAEVVEVGAREGSAGSAAGGSGPR